MITIDFTDQNIAELRREKYQNHPAYIQKRIDAVFLKSKGISHTHICEICEISKVSLSSYLKNYKHGGINALKKTAYKGKKNPLEKFLPQIKTKFVESSPATLKEARKTIKKVTGLERSVGQICKFLKKHKINIKSKN